MGRPNILVTDGIARTALAVVRSLGRAGYPVYVCASRGRSLAGASCYAVTQREVPAPLRDPIDFADAIVGLVKEWNISIIIPVSEEAMLALLPAAERMPGVRIPFAPLDVFKRVADKGAVTEMAATLGIAVPEQVVMTKRDVRPSAVDRLGFPLVLKPARSVAGDGAERSKMGVSYANDRKELVRQLDELPQQAFPLLVQRRIDGPGTGVFILLWQGEVLATFAHRRVREKPPSGGVSVLSASIAPDGATLERSVALL
ncbi:MAG TPA: hypothetical protein VHV78_06145, partial [Gemmatimonadaceae bacterium]|nr:hypothetical protein [Gemmatimonadaceae bacterium]